MGVRHPTAWLLRHRLTQVMSITPVGCSGHRAGELGALGRLARVYSAIEPRAVPGAADHGAQPDSGEHPEFRWVNTLLSNLKTMLARLM